MNTEARICQNCKVEFTIEPADFKFYEKIKVPPPTWCPECRLQRRLAWRNPRSIYKRTCDLCGEEKIGVYSPDKPFKVYCSPCWSSDKWDAMEYGRDYDFSRPLFEQYRDLLKAVPLMGLYVFESTMVNSEYTNMANYISSFFFWNERL
ncbi:MAG: hypothetical protein HY001_02190 [Candidatus Portnoybacteria bacterium]|nr:hypothetical protein [Candidatus Portnoybacteria bacterium]